MNGTVNFGGNTSTTAKGNTTITTPDILSGGLATIGSSASAAEPMVLTTSALGFADNTFKIHLTNNTLVATATLSAVRTKILSGSIETTTPGLAVGTMSISAGQIEARATRPGDTNLDGTVNFSDLLTVAQNDGHTNTIWSTGDINYDNTTNFTDLLALAQNYDKFLSLSPSELSQLDTASGSGFTQGFAQAEAQVSVPEPTALASIMCIAALAQAVAAPNLFEVSQVASVPPRLRHPNRLPSALSRSANAFRQRRGSEISG